MQISFLLWAFDVASYVEHHDSNYEANEGKETERPGLNQILKSEVMSLSASIWIVLILLI